MKNLHLLQHLNPPGHDCSFDGWICTPYAPKEHLRIVMEGFIMFTLPSCFFSQNLYQNRFLGLAAMASPSRASQGRRRCKDPIRHSFNPEQFPNVDFQNGLSEELAAAVLRSTSDTDLLTSHCRSTLTISTSSYTIGQTQDITLSWDIKEEVDAGDWIGMYLIGERGSVWLCFIVFVFGKSLTKAAFI